MKKIIAFIFVTILSATATFLALTSKAKEEVVGYTFNENGEVGSLSYSEFHQYDDCLDEKMFILASDGRYGVDQNAELNECVCRIRIQYKDTGAENFYATGVLVAPNVLVTNSHVVLDSVYGWPSTFEVTPAWSGGLGSNHATSCLSSAICGLFATTHNSNDDWAIVTLSHRYDEIKKFPAMSTSVKYSQNLFLLGYERLPYAAFPRLLRSDNLCWSVSKYKFTHKCDMIYEMDGSPIFDTSFRLIGVQSTEQSQTKLGITQPSYNTACRITNYIVGRVADVM